MENEIKLSYQDQVLKINLVGAGIKKYQVGGKDILYGYENDEQKAGSMGDILFPWPGRVENCQYFFMGKHYSLSGVRVKEGHANHGFVKTVPWQLTNQSDNAVSLRYDLTKEVYAEKGFPFDLGITISYTLDKNGLTCKTVVENSGKTDAPFGLGFHPYYTVGTKTINDMVLHIAADKLVEFDQSLKPTGKFPKPPKELDFSSPKKIGTTIIDNCYTDLHYANGIAQTKISNSQGTHIVIWQDRNYPYLQVYSADTIGEEHSRKGLALEPQTCTGYALNMPEMGLIVLKPGQIFEGDWGVQLKN